MPEFLLEHFWLIAGGILTSAFAGYIAYRNNQITRFAVASAVFHNAFADELAKLKNPANVGLDVRTLLLDAYDDHGRSAEIFRHHLSRLGKRKFDKAWQQYHSGHEFDAEAFRIPPKDRIFLEYPALGDDSFAIPLALKRIHALLRFAKQT